MAGPGEQATHNFERILCPFSQNAHKDTLFHTKNYTPLCNRCQPFAQIPAVEKRIFVAMYRFSTGVLCKLTYIFMASHIFSVVFLYFRRFSVCFSQPYHTNMAYCFLRYAQAFLPVAEALLSIFSIFHDMVTFCI